MDEILKDLNRKFEHTNLKQDAVEKDIVKLCQEAVEYDFYGVVVNPIWVQFANELTSSTKVKLISVCSFPLGTSLTEMKIKEALLAISKGASEIDMVANISDLKSDKFDKVENEITSLRKNIPFNTVLKVIIESGKLSDEQIKKATKAVINGGADFVKTSTGFFELPTVEQVKVMAEASEGRIEVKAAGGIRTLDDCRKYLEAGAARLGCSASVKIIEEWKNNS